MMKHSKQTIEPKHTKTRPRWASIETHDNRVIVTCSKCNFVDVERVERLHTLLVGVMTPHVKVVELDLRQVEGADTKLIAALVAILRLAHDCGVDLVIHTPPHVQGLIRFCRLDGIIRT